MRIRLAALSLVLALHARADLRVVGSDLLGLELSRALYEFGGRHGLTLALALDGSRPGLEQLGLARADLAIVALPEDAQPPAKGTVSLTVAYHALTVLAPAGIPVERVTFAELHRLFAGSRQNGAEAAPGPGIEANRDAVGITVAAPASTPGMMVDFFRQAVMQGQTLKGSVIRYADEAELEALLGEDRPTVALATTCPKRFAKIKTVPVAVGAGEPAFTPTPENLFAGDYPLRVPLRVVFRRDLAARMRPLLGFLFSDELASVLERAGLVPLASAARRQQRLVVENL